MRNIPHSKSFIDSSDEKSILKILRKGSITKGSLNKVFARMLGNVLDLDYINLTSSGTMAFYKILLALNVSNKDEILIPDYICNTLIKPIMQSGSKAVVYDNVDESWLSSIEIILKKITKKTKIIVINHTFGFAFQDILNLKKKLPSNIYIIEDCCHALANKSLIGKTKISIHSICSFYSFNATKLIATGEGGAIATNDKSFYKELMNINIGDNLSDLNCCLGMEQLKKLPVFLKKRKKIAGKYNQAFKDYRPNIFFKHDSIHYRYPILVNDNSKFLNSKSITYRNGVDSLCSDILKINAMQSAKKLICQTVSIPIYPSLSDQEINLVIKRTKLLLKNEN